MPSRKHLGVAINLIKKFEATGEWGEKDGIRRLSKNASLFWASKLYL